MAHGLTSNDAGANSCNGTALPRVLFVSESVDEREMYATAFGLYGFRTLQASTAAEAFRLASELSPSVVITDLWLSGADDGLALTTRLKGDGAMQGIPVVILSSDALMAEAGAIARSGCDLLLFKPCLPDALSQRAGELIARAATGRLKALRAD